MSEIAASCIPLRTLLEYHKMGFKLIPLGEDSKTPSVKWTDIYDTPEYWNEEKITENNGLFVNVAPTYGKTYVKDEKGMDLYLHELDIDSQEVFERLVNLQIHNKVYDFVREMCEKTFVVKTKKSFGYRIYWLSHKQHLPIAKNRCKVDHEFEIKSDKSIGHGTLPPSNYRDDINFRYQTEGQNKLLVEDRLYDGLVKVLEDCLKASNRGWEGNSHQSFNNQKIILGENDSNEIVNLIKQYYRKGSRNDVIFGISGLLWKESVKLQSAVTFHLYCNF